MAIRDLPTIDGRPACEVDTAAELTQVLVPGVWVRAPRAVLDACGLTEQENTDDERIAVEADQRDDAWIAPWQTPWTPGRVRVPVTRSTTRRTPAPPSTKE